MNNEPTYSIDEIIEFLKDQTLGKHELNTLIKVVQSDEIHYNKDAFKLINFWFYNKAKVLLGEFTPPI